MDPIEDFMRNILKKIMTCPNNNDDDYVMQRPVAALSPARYMQLIALVRKDSKEVSCGEVKPVSFEINDPRTWSFCAMGVCLSEECMCFQNFLGDKCNMFHGNCWLFYCFLIGCEYELPSLHCGCDSSLYGKTVTSGIYFYDEGLDNNYRPPPTDFMTIDEIETPIIRETFSGNYEVIGGNNRRMATTNASFRSYGRKELADSKREEYFLRRSNRIQPAEFHLVNNPVSLRGARGHQFLNLQNNYFKSFDLERPERNYQQEKNVYFIKNGEPAVVYNENNDYERIQFLPGRQRASNFAEHFKGETQNNQNIPSNYKHLRNKYSNHDFIERNRQFYEMETPLRNDRMKLRSRNMLFRNHVWNNEFVKPPFLRNDWNQENTYIQPRSSSKYERESRGIIRNREKFYEQQSNREIRAELSTLKVLWSDSGEAEDSEFKFVSENGKLSSQVSQNIFIIELFILIIIFL
ncbi:uncharacterized protein NPIL_47731 [Nephila pilipes]|uniref:Uncharacterized protein n=1 Tax=Nephila pilipes TaxID=299642 RepID=A0A8X6PCW9_NEPPI|nr:uncharacterized protein NPIL_47731 [Nephila pilipes]